MNKREIDRFFQILARELDAPAKVILTGAAAGSLYGHVRPSRDLDFQINVSRRTNWDQVDKAVQRAVLETGLQSNFAENIDRWGMISLLDYEKQARHYRKFGALTVLLMDPVYWSIGKLTRYLAPDRIDLSAVFQRAKPPLARTLRVWRRALQKSPRSLTQKKFLNHTSHFLKTEGKKIWGKNFDAEKAMEKVRESLP